MAKFGCKTHYPEDKNYFSYVHSQPGGDFVCCEEQCTSQALIWLNPSEVEAFERGCREFWDDEYTSVKTQDKAVKTFSPPLGGLASGIFGRGDKARQFKRSVSAKTVSVQKSHG